MPEKISIQKIISWGFYLMVFLLPWQTSWLAQAGELNGGFWEYGTFSLYATDLLFLLTLLLFVSWQFDRGVPPKNIKFSKLGFSLLAFLIIAALSTFWAVSQPLAWFGFLQLAEGLLLVWFLNTASFIKKDNGDIYFTCFDLFCF